MFTGIGHRPNTVQTLKLGAIDDFDTFRTRGVARLPAPEDAVAFARDAGLTGRVFNHYGYGGYLIGAGIPTFIDGRTDARVSSAVLARRRPCRNRPACRRSC